MGNTIIDMLLWGTELFNLEYQLEHFYHFMLLWETELDETYVYNCKNKENSQETKLFNLEYQLEHFYH